MRSSRHDRELRSDRWIDRLSELCQVQGLSWAGGTVHRQLDAPARRHSVELLTKNTRFRYFYTSSRIIDILGGIKH